MLTTFQRLKPSGGGWDTKFIKGAMDGNMSTLRAMDLLLNRALTLYWQRRPDPRELSDPVDTVAV